MDHLPLVSTRSLATPKLALLFFAVGLSLPAIGVCAGANPLIGSWRFSSTTSKGGAVDCNSSYVFTATSATISTPPSSVIPGGSTRTMQVTYVAASPKMVAMRPFQSSNVNFTFDDSNRMHTDELEGKCYYTRTK